MSAHQALYPIRTHGPRREGFTASGYYAWRS